MRVLIQSRANFYDLQGGDTVQLLNTKRELEKLGVGVDISLDFNPDLTDYDIVHLSNVTRIQETYLQMQNAKRYGKPVVLSTIFWPMDSFEQNGQYGIRKLINRHLSIDSIEKIKALARIIKNKENGNEATKKLVSVGYTKMQRYVLEHTDLFFPNAEIEMSMLNKHFGTNYDRYLVVPNAIDDSRVSKAFCKPEKEELKRYKNCVVCVGRIEPRKNQLELVRALDNSGLKLILVGAVSDNQKRYFSEVEKYIERNSGFEYWGTISQDEILELFKVAKVSVLPSWLDTPGLVSLEAASMGCNLAISTRGSTKEYFGDNAFYCEPDDSESIRKAVYRAIEADRNDILRNKVLSEYTWKKAAEITLKGYEAVL